MSVCVLWVSPMYCVIRKKIDMCFFIIFSFEVVKQWRLTTTNWSTSWLVRATPAYPHSPPTWKVGAGSEKSQSNRAPTAPEFAGTVFEDTPRGKVCVCVFIGMSVCALWVSPMYCVIRKKIDVCFFIIFSFEVVTQWRLTTTNWSTSRLVRATPADPHSTPYSKSRGRKRKIVVQQSPYCTPEHCSRPPNPPSGSFSCGWRRGPYSGVAVVSALAPARSPATSDAWAPSTGPRASPATPTSEIEHRPRPPMVKSSAAWRRRLLTDKTRIHLRSASVRTYTFFTMGFPRFLSIRGARGLLALNQVLI
jgi:hypothetical protein